MSQLHLTEIGRVALPSADVDSAVDFYTQTLGFEKRMDETFGDGSMRWVELVPPGSSTAIAIAPPPPGQEAQPVDSGIIITTSDLDADHAALKDAGVDVDAEIMRMPPPVPPMFRFRDPNGHQLTIVQPLT